MSNLRQVSFTTPIKYIPITCTHTYAYIPCTPIHAHTCYMLHTCTSTHFPCTNIHARTMHTNTFMRMHTHTYIHTMHTNTFMRMHTHTYIHTYIPCTHISHTYKHTRPCYIYFHTHSVVQSTRKLQRSPTARAPAGRWSNLVKIC